MTGRQDTTITAGDGTPLAAWWHPTTGDRPTIVLSHGLSAIKAMGLDRYAERFRDAGLNCVVYDHRGYGASGGVPRHESDPWQQVHDMRDVITWVRQRGDADPHRIGLWGTR